MQEWAKIVLNSKNQESFTNAFRWEGQHCNSNFIKSKIILNVEAIHFIHSWGSSIPTHEAKRICREYSIPLRIVDFTAEFCSAIFRVYWWSTMPVV